MRDLVQRHISRGAVYHGLFRRSVPTYAALTWGHPCHSHVQHRDRCFHDTASALGPEVKQPEPGLLWLGITSFPGGLHWLDYPRQCAVEALRFIGPWSRWVLESLGLSLSALFIAKHLAQTKHMKLLALALIILFVTACESGLDRLEALATQFSSHRESLNEARRLLLSLAHEENILGIKIGARYNDQTDQVWLHHNSQPESLTAISLKNPSNKSKLERVFEVARAASLEASHLDEFGQFRAVASTGRSYDYGYEFFTRSSAPTPENGAYRRIAGEENWYAFRR